MILQALSLSLSDYYSDFQIKKPFFNQEVKPAG